VTEINLGKGFTSAMNEFWKILFILLIRLSNAYNINIHETRFLWKHEACIAAAWSVRQARVVEKREISQRWHVVFPRWSRFNIHRSDMNFCARTYVHLVVSVNRHCFNHIKYQHLAISGENGGSYPSHLPCGTIILQNIRRRCRRRRRRRAAIYRD